MAQPIVGHLDPFFFETSDDVSRMLRHVFGTRNELTFAISATGSGGMEAAIANLVAPGTKVTCFINGFFCERMYEMARRQGGQVSRFDRTWGEVAGDGDAAEFIERSKPDVVTYVHAETSTGALQDGRAICEAAHRVGAVVIADCVTSLGALPVEVDATGIDVAYSCTQKGLSCPPGLSPITISPRAYEAMQRLKQRTWYLDLVLISNYLLRDRKYHHTASASLFYALREGLRSIEEEGLSNRWERHSRVHRQFVEGIEKLGLTMHVAEGHRIPNLNTPRVPEGVDDAQVRARLLNEHGIEIAGGFGPLAGKVFRVGTMGPLATDEHITDFLDKFGVALRN